MKKLKRIAVGLLIVAMCSQSFAAVVSDNDGSAFITKAEFDSLKNNFQAQIDNYNSSLDSKIDGAIASYLAGIQIASTEQHRVMCYSTNGIYSVTTNDTNVRWKEGLMRFGAVLGSVGAYLTTGGDYQGKYALWSIQMGLGLPFTTTGLTKVNSARTGGLWSGLITNYQTLSIAQVRSTTASLSASDATLASRIVGLYNWPSITNKDIKNDRSLLGVELGWGSNWKTYQQEYFDLDYALLSRLSTATNYKNIIVTPASVPYGRFEDTDDVKDFYNDTNTDGHTKSVDLYNATSGIGSTIKLFYKRYSINYNYYENSQNWDTGTDPGTHVRPYIGFITTITDWNKIANDVYDTEISTIKSYNPTTNKYLWKDNDNNEHLYLSAGVPIVEIKKDQILEFDINFQDTTKNYRIYLHDGPFDNNVNMASHTGLYNNTEMELTSGGTYYGTIINGHGHVKLKAKSNNIIFMKWTLGDSNDNGGGTFLPPINCTITREN